MAEGCTCCRLAAENKALLDQNGTLALQLGRLAEELATVKTEVEALKSRLPQPKPPGEKRKVLNRYKWLNVERAIRVLEMCVLGKDDQEIAEVLGISPSASRKVRSGSLYVPLKVREVRAAWLAERPWANLYPLKHMNKQDVK